MIVPAFDGAGHLRACLEALQASTFAGHEVIVVDDASTDDTAEVARAMGARVVRQEERGGPAQARNAGAAVARGDYLLFLDADVCVRPDTLAIAMERCAQDGSIDALFGSYDPAPSAPNFLSQWRNLLHHHVHQEGREEASTFWTGCGAIKRSVFHEVRGFDPRYRRPSVEDIELGARLRRAGRRVVLDKRLQVTHLKRWTLPGMLLVDVRDRAIPWMQLILREGRAPDDLNLGLRHRGSAVLAHLVVLALAVAAWQRPAALLLPCLAILGVAVVDYLSDRRGAPATARVLSALLTLGAGALAALLARPSILAAVACLVLVVLLNRRFYALVAREGHPTLLAPAAVLHLLHYLACGVGLGLGLLLHLTRRPAAAEQPSPAAVPRVPLAAEPPSA